MSSDASIISRYLCTLCQEDQGPCTCGQPCGSVLCQQFPDTCGTYPNGLAFHCWEPRPLLSLEQIRHWKVDQPPGPCMCGERTLPVQ